MFFKNKSVKCSNCSSSINSNFSFCPYCGRSLLNPEKELKEFGMLGRNDFLPEEFSQRQFAESGGGFADKIFESLINGLMKSVEKQFRDSSVMSHEVKSMPNGIKIRIGPVQSSQEKASKRQASRKTLSPDQLERMSSLPRATAKSSVRRLSDKVIYELSTPGLESPEDVFVSKLEQGYEVKAIGKRKVYVNSLPVDLPLKGLLIQDNKLFVEFKTQME